tara:strand:+ start:484 stop:867 length:384 start_codon:yes stop_codon:yes gene_type:complete
VDCPCGNKKSYKECCEIAHHSLKSAITAEQLMRSRYTAFTLANGDYLMESHHVSTRPISEKKEIVAWAKSVEWLELKIAYTTKGLENDNEGTVAFEAFFKENGELNAIKEHSKFVKENGCWYYLDFV